MRRFLPYVCLALWATWLFALQGWWASGRVAGPWVPDLGVALLVAIAARSGFERALGAALVVALARAALSADPSAALLLGYALVAIGAASLGGALDLDRPLLRALLAGLGGALLAWLLPFTGALRAAAQPESIGEHRVLAAALATAAVALVAGRRLRALPGLGALWREDGRWLLVARRR